jgi:hypothetical protein
VQRLAVDEHDTVEIDDELLGVGNGCELLSEVVRVREIDLSRDADVRDVCGHAVEVLQLE